MREMMSSPNRKEKESSISSVKFIARMQWVACGDHNGYISVYTYADDRLTGFMRFKAEEGRVHALVLAVHPTLPYLLSSSTSNLIKLWNWDQQWMCTRKFSNSSSTDIFSTRRMIFNPKDANSFASLDNNGEINVWRHSLFPRHSLHTDHHTLHLICLISLYHAIIICRSGA